MDSNSWQSDNNKKTTNRETFFSYFSENNKDELAKLANNLSSEAKEFFDGSIAGLLGQLPDEMADTSLTMNKNGLSRLLFSSMVTGYLAKSIEDKLQLEKMLYGEEEKPKQTLQDKIVHKPSFLNEDFGNLF